MKFILVVALLFLSVGPSQAQSLQDEDKAVQNLHPANDLNIPQKFAAWMSLCCGRGRASVSSQSVLQSQADSTRDTWLCQ